MGSLLGVERVGAQDAHVMVYENLTIGGESEVLAHYVLNEYGDEIEFKDKKGWRISDFGVDYYGDFPEGTVATAVVRLYRNDGPDADPGSPVVRAPSTLLYQSSAQPLTAGYSELLLTNLSVELPARVTWTVEFVGLSGAPGNRAGLLFEHPPSVGRSFDDFWEKRNGVWGVYRFGGNPIANFGARFRAFSAPFLLPDFARVEMLTNTTHNLAFTILSTVLDPGVLTVTVTAADPVLLPVGTGLVLGGTGLVRTLAITPAVGQKGTTRVTVTVRDSAGVTATKSFDVRVTDGTSSIGVTPIADQEIRVDQSTGLIPFRVTGLAEEGGLANTLKRSSNPELVQDAFVEVSGSLQTFELTVRVTPRPGRTGESVITLTFVANSGATGTVSFKVRVVADPPLAGLEILPLEAASGAEDTPMRIVVRVIQRVPAVSDLRPVRVTLASGWEGLFREVRVDAPPGPGAPTSTTEHGFTLIPRPDANGSAELVFVASDDANHTARATVPVELRPVDDAPSVRLAAVDGVPWVGEGLSWSLLGPGAPLPRYRFDVADPDTAMAALDFRLVMEPADALLADSYRVVPGAGFVELTPGAGAGVLNGGTVRLTLEARDGTGLGQGTVFLTLTALPPRVTVTGTPTVLEGETLTLRAEATELGGRPPESVRWTRADGTLVGSGLNLTVAAVRREDTGLYQVTVRNHLGAEGSASVWVDVVRRVSVAGVGGQSRVVRAGEDVEFSVVARSDGEVSYEWSRAGRMLEGETGSSLRLSAVDLEDAGSYVCTVRDAWSSAESAPFVLRVLQGPRIVEQPEPVTVDPGGTAVFRVVAEGSGALRYQWRRNGVNLRGANGAMLTLTEVDPGQSGQMDVVVQGSGGATTSRTVALEVRVRSFEFADGFADRRLLPLENAVSGRVAMPGTEEGEPSLPGAWGSVWASWEASVTGVAAFDVAGSEVAVGLQAFRGDLVAGLSLQAGVTTGGGSARIEFPVSQGQRFELRLRVSKRAEGRVVLGWTIEPRAELPPRILQQPVSVVTRIEGGRVVPVRLTVEAENPGGDAGSLSYEWYRSVARRGSAGRDLVAIGTGESSVTVDQVGIYGVTVRNGSGATASDLVRVSARGSSVATAAVGGSSSGIGLQSVRKADVVETLAEASEFPESGDLGTLLVDTTLSATEPGEPTPCGLIGGASQWFNYRAPASGRLIVGTTGSDFETVLSVYGGNGSDYAGLIPITCDGGKGTNGSSRVEFEVVAGRDYYISADGVDGSSGILAIEYRLEAAPGLPAVPDVVMAEDTRGRTLDVPVAFGATVPAEVDLSARASDTALFPGGGVVLTRTETGLRLSLTPAADGNGEAVITIRAASALGASTTSFKATVTPVNDPPRIGPLGTLVLPFAPASIPVDLTVTDPDHSIEALRFSASSPNPALVPASGLAVESANGTVRLTVVPVPGVSGAASIEVRATDPDGAVGSASLMLWIDSSSGIPLVLAAPESRSVTAGDSVSLRVVANGAAPLGYQWYYNGTRLTVETNATLTIEGAESHESGLYSVVVTNALGTAVTAPARLEVTEPPLEIGGALVAGGFELEVTGPPGIYAVEVSTDLIGWTAIGTVDLRSRRAVHADPSAGGVPRRFYRVVARP